MYTNAIGASANILMITSQLTLPTDWQRSCVCCEDFVHVSGFLHLLPTTVDWKMLSGLKLPWRRVLFRELIGFDWYPLAGIFYWTGNHRFYSQGYRDNLHYHLIFLQFHISTWDWANLSSPLFDDLVSRFPSLSKTANNCPEVSKGDLPLRCCRRRPPLPSYRDTI